MAIDRGKLEELRPKPKAVRIESLGDDVLFKQLSARDALRVMRDFGDAGEDASEQFEAGLRVVMMTAVQDDGSALFLSDEEVSDLGDSVAYDLIRAAAEVNGFSAEDAEGN